MNDQKGSAQGGQGQGDTRFALGSANGEGVIGEGRRQVKDRHMAIQTAGNI